MKILHLLLCTATLAAGEAPNPNIVIDRFAILTKEVGKNIPTFITLHGHGYTNVHELGPLLHINTTRIPFAGKSVK